MSTIYDYHRMSEKVREKHLSVQVRAKMLLDAQAELDDCLKELLREAEARYISRNLTKRKQAELVGLGKSRFYELDLQSRNYADLWQKVKKRCPKRLRTLESNYRKYIESI